MINCNYKKKDINNMSDKKYVKSKIQFYIPEIIIFILYISLGLWASVRAENFLLTVNMSAICGVISYIFFIIEHRTDLVLDKINNIIIVREKMLFFDRYKIKKQQYLDMVSNACVYRTFSYDKERRRTTSDSLKIINKNGSGFFPFGEQHDKNCQNLVDKINNFNNSHEPLLIITKKPFILRLCFFVLFGLPYLIICFYTIFPKEMEPAMYYLMNILCSINGYQQ